jgi:N-acetylmuramoyl-L-alanine amidase CwlA
VVSFDETVNMRETKVRVPFIPYVQGRNDYTDGDNRKYGFAIHNTSNNASDSGEASYAARRTDGISAHLYADADSVTQSIDTEDKTGHAGSGHGNENAISIEITGANGKSRDWWLANVAWDLLGRVIAYRTSRASRSGAPRWPR